MRILVHSALLLILTFIFSSCSLAQKGPVTHAQAFLAVREAFIQSDPGHFEKLLSRNSMHYLAKVADAMQELSPESKAYLAKNTGIKREQLNTISPDDYTKIYFEMNKTYQKDIIAQSITKNPLDVTADKESACYLMPNAVKLYFRREAPYWKFDFERSIQ